MVQSKNRAVSRAGRRLCVLGMTALVGLSAWSLGPGTRPSLAAPRARDGGKKVAAPAGPLSPLEAPGWTVQNEWTINGNYAEISNDRGVCPGLFLAPSCGGLSQKAIVLQIIDGHYKTISLKSLSVVLLVESPPGEALLWENRARWKRADLLLPESADSLQAEALVRTVGPLVNGLDGPKFTSIERVPLGVGFSRDRILVSVPDRIEFLLHPVMGANQVSPVQIQNQRGPFPFLGYVNLALADTLFARPGPGGPEWRWGGTAGFSTNFGWSRERAEATRAEAIRQPRR